MKSIRCEVLENVYSTCMSITEFDPAQLNPTDGPACAKCGGPVRLTGIEPHPTKAGTDLRTYQCLACDHVQAAMVPLGA